MEVKQIEIFVPNEEQARIFEVGKEEVTHIFISDSNVTAVRITFLDGSRVFFERMPFIAKNNE